MIIPDANLLIYAYNDQDPLQVAAQSWWESLLQGHEPVGLPWIVSTAFVRVLSDRRILPVPATPEQAVDFVREWFEASSVVPIEPGPNHLTYLRRNLVVAGVGGNLVPDAHIAALAMEYQAEVHSHDSDFGRFPDVRWHDPIRNPR
ncbi:MAG: type II toxin-antitoxin system VapC family toxin [Chloroflexi bacterium]|nr:type II toxin-antitoxin system VapC family toxin [Chloroflexota bacterium]MXW23206.1 type II toxin-antitoxin system VapC family toxin [Chloroflexota bacterium]MYE33150.1 type II toxin-antitoxin system VapC family toxin [Chloroflexota bacterium]